MIIRVVFTNCSQKIHAIKILRAIGSFSLKEAKDLVDVLDKRVPGGSLNCSLNGEYRLQVNAEKTLTGLLPLLNGGSAASGLSVGLPEGMNLYPEQIDIIDCREKQL